ncbi:MAG: hypothetical protein HQ553_12720 [Chloroflexi bacterium]|nr:hypothetical protein [Chloroflexota bacterium]
MTEAIEHLRQSITEGKHWYLALLEAIGLWQLKEETFNGRHHKYLIAGEAFDLLLLAQRLCAEADDIIPESEKTDLFFGKLPMELSKEELKSLIGSAKYRALLNYFYGITVERTLHLAIQMEMEKELSGNIHRRDLDDDVFHRIYDSSETSLLERFRKENGYTQCDSIVLTELDEFTYWLFKYRFANCERARVASDTKKALKLLEEIQQDGIHF